MLASKKTQLATATKRSNNASSDSSEDLKDAGIPPISSTFWIFSSSSFLYLLILMFVIQLCPVQMLLQHAL